jgi:hypothetical protein
MPAVSKSVHASRVEERACVLTNVHASRVDSLLKFNLKRVHADVLEIRANLSESVFEALFNDS